MRLHTKTHPHPLQYLGQMCIQSVLSATDLLHVPLEFLDQDLQFTDALVRFVSRTAKRPGLNKDQKKGREDKFNYYYKFNLHMCD